MKRLIVLVLGGAVLALLFLMVGVAGANGGPHGSYTATTDACAGCHRAHTAPEPKLLVATESNLCFTCHGASATGADTNVENGVYGVNNLGLKAGGFTNALMSTDFGTAASASTTSSHTYDGSLATAWGNGSSGAGATNFALSCTNCHDPHGNGNYRILRGIPSNSGAGTAVNVADESPKTYSIADAGGLYFGEGRIDKFGNSAQYEALTAWCTQCHTRYQAGRDSATTDSGDAIFAYRHMAGEASNGGTPGVGTCATCHGSPFSSTPLVTFNETYWNHQVDCVTCHVSHGTSASVTGFAAGLAWPDGASPEDSALLRLDNRGVCEACHNK